MQLLYVWIQSYSNIKGQGFNLGGSPYHFEYGEKGLIVSKDDNNIEGFFNSSEENGLARISNISAVVGANGSGKSSLLKLLTFFEYGNIILCFKNSDKRYVTHSFYDRDAKIEGNYDEKEYGFEFMPLKDEDFKKELPKPIFFSNSFDSADSLDVSGLINISTNYILKNLTQDLSFEHQTGHNNSNVLYQYRKYEIQRQLNFIKEINTHIKKVDEQWEMIEFDIPDKLIVNIHQLYKYESLSSLSHHQKNVIEEVYSNNIELFSQKVKNYILSLESNKDKVFTTLEYSVLFQFIYYIALGYTKSHKDIKFDIKLLEEDISKDLFIRIIESFIKEAELSSYLNTIVELKEHLINRLENIKTFIQNIKEKWIIKDSDCINENSFIIYIKDDDNINNFLDEYIGTITSFGYLDFNWGWDLSTGQNAFLNLYSLFWWINDNQFPKNGHLKENLLILIDEGDIYLHPKWQKEFINRLIRFLPICFKKTPLVKNIQIILTSHSPFVLSDLPKDNVIFLDTYKEDVKAVLEGEKVVIQKKGNCKVVKGIEREQTFGANIHTLLADGFFMEDGLMGEFAKEKIQEVIKTLKNAIEKKGELSASEKEKVEKTKKVIDIIGEPVIKQKLVMMYYNALKIDGEIDLIDIQMKELQKRKDEAERRKAETKKGGKSE